MGFLSSSQTTSGSSSVTPTLAPGMEGFQDDLMAQLRKKLLDPSGGMDGIKTGLFDGINKSYAGAAPRLMESLASRGLNNSGVASKGLMGLEMGRLGDLGGAETRVAGMQMDQSNNTIQQIMALLDDNRGQSSTSTQKTTMNPSILSGILAMVNTGIGAATGVKGLMK